MIRVTLEVDAYGHEFKIERESVLYGDNRTTRILDDLIRSAQASMNAALTAEPIARDNA